MHLLLEAYILHSRVLSDSKVVLEIFTKALGRVKAVARVPAKKNRAQFQIFQPLVMGFKGTGELKTLTQSEPVPDRRLQLSGNSLFCAMYINELVQRVTAVEDADTALFSAYEDALTSLATATVTPEREVALRTFEFTLLASAGYEINFLEDTTGMQVLPSVRYLFDPSDGFNPTLKGGFSGESLLALDQRDFSQPQTRQDAKNISRAALRPLLGNRPIKSRDLFR